MHILILQIFTFSKNRTFCINSTSHGFSTYEYTCDAMENRLNYVKKTWTMNQSDRQGEFPDAYKDFVNQYGEVYFEEGESLN